MITLYDLAAKPPIKTWSPNPWKARYVLNLKKLPYKTVYLEFADIEGVFKEAGIPPIKNMLDGTPLYTSPSIVDDATGVAIPDSFKIAEYLDKQYPDTPRAFPAGSEALQAAFYDHFNQLLPPIAPLIVAQIPGVLNPGAQEHYRRTRKRFFGKPFDQIGPVGEERKKAWNHVKEFHGSLDGWYSKNAGPYFIGDVPSFADFTVASMLQAIRIVAGEDSEDWKSVSAWNDGRWVKLMNDLEKYASTEN